MDPDERALLQKVADLSEKNNVILKKLYRHMRVQRAFHIVYWIIIIGASIGLYYWIQPIVDQFLEIYASVGGAAENFRGFFGS